MKLSAKNELTGVLLTGGKSSRMGKHKVLLPHGDQNFGQHLLGLLDQLCGNIIISQNHRLIQSPYRSIPDIYPEIGPMGGIHATLKECNTPWCLVVACDLPQLNIEALLPLLCKAEDCKAVCYHIDGHYEPLCAIYHYSILPDIVAAIHSERYSLQKLLESVQAKTIVPDEKTLLQLYNVNTPEELQAFYQHKNEKR